MWILNICIFASASENGALILYFTKLNFMSKKSSLLVQPLPF